MVTMGNPTLFASITTAAALLVAGCSAPDNAAETVAQAPAAETVTALVESKDVPSGIAGLTIAELHQDASETLASVPESVPAGAYAFIPEYAASYETAAPEFPADYFVIDSFDRPGVIHVFHITTALRA
jgi:hypothetical protein